MDSKIILKNINPHIFDKEFPVPNDIDSSWPIYELINNFKKTDNDNLCGRKKMHKLIFLIMAKENINIPFDFLKNEYGPYSKNLERNKNHMIKDGYLKESKLILHGYEGNKFMLTTKGINKYEKEIKPLIKKYPYLKNAFKSICNKYRMFRGQDLEDLCYGNFYLTRDKDPKILNSIRTSWIKIISNDIHKIEKKWDSIPDEYLTEIVRFNILTSIDYLKKIVNSNKILKIDQVESGVLLKNVEYFCRLNNYILTLIEKRPFSSKLSVTVNDSFEQISRLFYFINSYSEKCGILPSMFNEDSDIISLMDDGDKKRILLQTI